MSEQQYTPEQAAVTVSQFITATAANLEQMRFAAECLAILGDGEKGPFQQYNESMFYKAVAEGAGNINAILQGVGGLAIRYQSSDGNKYNARLLQLASLSSDDGSCTFVVRRLPHMLAHQVNVQAGDVQKLLLGAED